MMFGGSDGAMVCVFGEGVGAATKGADNEGGRAAAVVDVVAEAMAT